MNAGFFTAASGILNQQRSLDLISNNIANATTAGYKGQIAVQTSFADHMVSRLNENDAITEPKLGTLSYLAADVSEYTNMKQGSLEFTNRPFDAAINGEGFFVVENDTYGEAATRNGQFALDEEGYLYLAGAGKVLNEGGSPIQLDDSRFTIDRAGIIYDSAGDEIDKLYIAKMPEKFTRTDNDLYILPNGESFEQEESTQYQVIQGAIEKGNVDMAQEMSRIIAGQNNFNSCVQILKIYDKLNEISANQIGRLG